MSSNIINKEVRNGIAEMIERDKPEGWELALESFKKHNAIREGIYNACKVYNLLPMLFHVDDVKEFYDVTDKEAYDILEEAFEHEAVIQAVFNAISYICERDEIEQKEDV